MNGLRKEFQFWLVVLVFCNLATVIGILALSLQFERLSRQPTTRTTGFSVEVPDASQR